MIWGDLGGFWGILGGGCSGPGGVWGAVQGPLGGLEEPRGDSRGSWGWFGDSERLGGAGFFGGAPEGALEGVGEVLGVFRGALEVFGWVSRGCLGGALRGFGWGSLGVFGGYLFGVPRLRRRLRLPALAEAAALSQSRCGCCPPRFLSGCHCPPPAITSQSGARVFPPTAPSAAFPPLPNGGAHGPRLRRWRPAAASGTRRSPAAASPSRPLPRFHRFFAFFSRFSSSLRLWGPGGSAVSRGVPSRGLSPHARPPC